MGASDTRIPTAAPFLKWAGGKARLLPVILPRLPDQTRTYFEPFLGGGAVFFAMASAGRFRRAVLSDKNLDLVHTYSVVRDSLKDLVTCLKPHAANATDSDYFYSVRAQNPDALDPIERAARLIFLNRTCFNGLYRVNRKGEFNVPFGKYNNPKVIDEAKLQAASWALQKATIKCADFSDVARDAKRGDAVYLDPPYVPISATSSFSSYHLEAFGPKTQAKLLDVYKRCWMRGATAIMSNSDCDFTRELYRSVEVEVVRAARAINSVGSGRGQINELLVVGPRKKVKPQSTDKPSHWTPLQAVSS